MKPASIIFLIIAVLLIGAGALTCYLAWNNATEAGIDLFDQTVQEDGDLFERAELPFVTKIILTADNRETDVHVIGGAENSYVEMRNFPFASFTSDLQNGVYTFTDKVSLYDKLTAVRKNGLRHLLRSSTFRPERRSLTIHLADDAAVTQFEIHVHNGSCTVESVTYPAGYTVILTSGDVSFDRIATDGKVSAATETGTVSFTGCTVRDYDVTVGNGSFLCSLVPNGTELYNLRTALGTVRMFGEDKGPNVTSGGRSDYQVSATVSLGTIEINTYEGEAAEIKTDAAEEETDAAIINADEKQTAESDSSAEGSDAEETEETTESEETVANSAEAA